MEELLSAEEPRDGVEMTSKGFLDMFAQDDEGDGVSSQEDS